MELDARRLPDGARLDAELCIIGGGPAGLTLAREFIGLDIRVLLLESGGPTREEWPQALSGGAVVGDPYAGLMATRRRQVGGTAQAWNTPAAGRNGAKYVPLDPADFAPASTGFGRPWPIGLADLDPFYRRAQTVCGLGRFGYEATDWPDPVRSPFPLPGGSLTTRVYQFGTSDPFTKTCPGQIREAANVRLCIHATVCRLVPDATRSRVVEARIGSASGLWQTVRAKTFVLAAGAIENPRLLLASGLGNDLVGRGFIEHPRDRSLTLVPRAPELFHQAAFYDAHTAGDGTIVGGRIALVEDARRRFDLPNASITLLPRVRRTRPPAGPVARVRARIRSAITPARRGGYGWSREPNPGAAFDAFTLLMNLEQRPHPDNRVVLAEEKDALGVPRAQLHWRWRPEDQAALDRLRGLVISALEGAGLGRIEVGPAGGIDPNAHHHAGTTRMDHDPALGVADPSGKLFGTENLFLVGSSLFPSCGFANPTLTVVALALRLADHLKAGSAG